MQLCGDERSVKFTASRIRLYGGCLRSGVLKMSSDNDEIEINLVSVSVEALLIFYGERHVYVTLDKLNAKACYINIFF